MSKPKKFKKIMVPPPKSLEEAVETHPSQGGQTSIPTSEEDAPISQAMLQQSAEAQINPLPPSLSPTLRNPNYQPPTGESAQIGPPPQSPPTSTPDSLEPKLPTTDLMTKEPLLTEENIHAGDTTPPLTEDEIKILESPEFLDDDDPEEGPEINQDFMRMAVYLQSNEFNDGNVLYHLRAVFAREGGMPMPTFWAVPDYKRHGCMDTLSYLITERLRNPAELAKIWPDVAFVMGDNISNTQWTVGVIIDMTLFRILPAFRHSLETQS